MMAMRSAVVSAGASPGKNRPVPSPAGHSRAGHRSRMIHTLSGRACRRRARAARGARLGGRLWTWASVSADCKTMASRSVVHARVSPPVTAACSPWHILGVRWRACPAQRANSISSGEGGRCAPGEVGDSPPAGAEAWKAAMPWPCAATASTVRHDPRSPHAPGHGARLGGRGRPVAWDTRAGPRRAASGTSCDPRPPTLTRGLSSP